MHDHPPVSAPTERSNAVPRSRRLIAVVAAALLVLTIAGPAFAYHGSLGLQIRMARLDPLQCGTNIRLAVDVVDRHGELRSGVDVNLSMHNKRRNDRLGPQLGTPYTEETRTDANGRATSTEAPGRPYVRLACFPQTRQVVARIYSHDGQRLLVEKVLRLRCNHQNGCID
jgi:hypothetical protein